MKPRLSHLPFLFALAVLAPAHAHDGDSQAGALGKVSFPSSCDPKVQPTFERGVAMLHSFWYSAAEKTFRDVLKDDPGCAIATNCFARHAAFRSRRENFQRHGSGPSTGNRIA